jgi:hypothetical protein
MAYSKLHSSLVNSSLWTQPDSVRILFITLLSMCDQHGEVQGSKRGLTRIANIEPDDEDEAWHALMSPDSSSSDHLRNPEHQGRRIEEIPGGFRLLNFAYYRGIRNEDDRREQNRVAQARFKAKHAATSPSKPPKSAVIQGNPSKSQAEAEAEAEAEKKDISRKKKVPSLTEAIEYGATIGMSKEDVESWHDHFEANGWKVSGKTPMRDWRAGLRNGKRMADKFKQQNGRASKRAREFVDPADRKRRIADLRERKSNFFKFGKTSLTDEERVERKSIIQQLRELEQQ